MTSRLSPTRGGVRVLRGGLLASCSATLAVAAHGIAGGGLPDTGLTLLLTLGTAAAGTALADRRRGLPSILTALGASQLGMHLILTVLAGHGSGASGGSGNGLPMLAAHVLAVLLTAALLTHAESALFALVTTITMLLPMRLSSPPASRPLTVLVPPPWHADRLRGVLLRHFAPRRGPPAHS